MLTSLGVMRIFPIQIITEEGRVIKGLCSSRGVLLGRLHLIAMPATYGAAEVVMPRCGVVFMPTE
jgi:hypothetical protein